MFHREYRSIVFARVPSTSICFRVRVIKCTCAITHSRIYSTISRAHYCFGTAPFGHERTPRHRRIRLRWSIVAMIGARACSFLIPQWSKTHRDCSYSPEASKSPTRRGRLHLVCTICSEREEERIETFPFSLRSISKIGTKQKTNIIKCKLHRVRFVTLTRRCRAKVPLVCGSFLSCSASCAFLCIETVCFIDAAAVSPFNQFASLSPSLSTQFWVSRLGHCFLITFRVYILFSVFISLLLIAKHFCCHLHLFAVCFCFHRKILTVSRMHCSELMARTATRTVHNLHNEFCCVRAVPVPESPHLGRAEADTKSTYFQNFANKTKKIGENSAMKVFVLCNTAVSRGGLQQINVWVCIGRLRTKREESHTYTVQSCIAIGVNATEWRMAKKNPFVLFVEQFLEETRVCAVFKWIDTAARIHQIKWR